MGTGNLRHTRIGTILFLALLALLTVGILIVRSRKRSVAEMNSGTLQFIRELKSEHAESIVYPDTSDIIPATAKENADAKSRKKKERTGIRKKSVAARSITVSAKPRNPLADTIPAKRK